MVLKQRSQWVEYFYRWARLLLLLLLLLLLPLDPLHGRSASHRAEAPRPWPGRCCRALQPGRHYLEFWVHSKDDVFELVPKLNQE